MKIIDIGELSASSGVPPSTLRYYEEIGLIESIGRRGMRRQFGGEALTQLALISLGKTAGFSLDEIRGMFGKDGAPNVPRAAIHARAEALDVQIRRMTALRNALRHVAECPAETHMDCPKFRRLLIVASRSTRRPGRTSGRS